MFKAVEPVAAVKVFEVFSELLGLASAKGKILFLIYKKNPLWGVTVHQITVSGHVWASLKSVNLIWIPV